MCQMFHCIQDDRSQASINELVRPVMITSFGNWIAMTATGSLRALDRFGIIVCGQHHFTIFRTQADFFHDQFDSIDCFFIDQALFEITFCLEVTTDDFCFDASWTTASSTIPKPTRFTPISVGDK